MQYDYNEFYPCNITREINKTSVELLPLNLKNLLTLEEEFCELKKLEEYIKEKPLRLFDVFWLFVDDKKRFNYSPKEFSNFCQAGSIQENTKLCYLTLHKIITNSSPIIKNQERYDAIQAIKKSKTEENSTKPCFANIYDKFASRYSMSIESFYSMTMRQIHALLEVMDKNEYKELEVQAALMGKKLKPKLNAHAIDEEEDKKLDDQAEDMLKRMQQEYALNRMKKQNE